MEFFALRSIKKELQARNFRKIPEFIFYLFLLWLPMWFTFKLIPQDVVIGNTYYLLQNNLYLLCSGCQYLMRFSCEVQIFSCFQTFSNFKFTFLVRELTMVFRTERLFFPWMLKDFKSSVTNSTLEAKIKCSKWLVRFYICDRHTCQSYTICLGFCNKPFVQQLRMQTILIISQYWYLLLYLHNFSLLAKISFKNERRSLQSPI